jgi:molecular chaperone IbpA
MRTTNVSFGPIWPSSVGFDNIIGELDALLNAQAPTSTFPPHNIIKVDDYNYIVELAIAGFNKQEVTITLKDSVLEIKGQKNPDREDTQYLHKGIGTRSFIKTIKLADTVEVVGSAEIENGILRVALCNVIPDSKKPRSIQVIDGKQPAANIDRVRELLNERDNLSKEILTDYAKDANYASGQQYDMDS